MKTWVHVVVSSIIALVLYPVFNWTVLLILVGGVLIDIDHYIWYIFKHKNFDIFECYRQFTEVGEKSNFRIFSGITLFFHTIEFTILMLILSFINELALMFTIGLVVHYFLDIIHQFYLTRSMIINPSMVSWLIKNNK